MIIKIEESSEFYEKIINTLKRGEIVALPAETHYVLAGDGTDSRVIERLNNLKKVEKEFNIFFITRSNIGHYGFVVKKRLIDYFLPGPIIFILKKNPQNSLPMTQDKLGIWIPDFDFIKRLLNIYENPIYVINPAPSRNLPFTSAYEISDTYQNIKLVIDGGNLSGVPTTVCDLTTTPPTIRQKGKVQILAIEKIYGRKVIFDGSLKFNLLFVCTGNTCRSPMAMGIIKKMIPEDYLDVRTAGTAAIDGLPPSPNAQIVVKEFGGEIESHRTKPLNKELIDEADLILVMEYKHYKTVLEMSPDATAKTFLLKEYKRRTKDNEIPDPIGKELSAYRDCALDMYPSLKLVAREIKKRFKGDEGNPRRV